MAVTQEAWSITVRYLRLYPKSWHSEEGTGGGRILPSEAEPFLEQGQASGKRRGGGMAEQGKGVWVKSSVLFLGRLCLPGGSGPGV